MRRLFENLCPQEAVALLFNVVVDDAGELFLPDLQPVDAHVVLDVLERASVTVDGRSEMLEARNELALFGFRVEDEAFVKRSSDALHQLLSNAVLQQLLRVDLNTNTFMKTSVT